MIELKVRPFYLMRHSDVNGLSGVGVVGTGVVFANNTTVFQWSTYSSSLEIHTSLEVFTALHSHNGASEVIFGQPPCTDTKKTSRKKKEI